MTFELWFKNKLEKLFIPKKAEIELEFRQKEEELRKGFEDSFTKVKNDIDEKLSKLRKQQADLEDDEQRVLDRKKELAKTNEELKVQIRLIEAKASPDSVWAEAFGHGFSKAWDMMLPIMMDGIQKVKDEIRNQEIDNSMPRLNSMVNERITQLGKYELKPVEELIAKKNEFIMRKAKATDLIEKQKYDNFIKTLDWMLVSRNGN